MVLGDVRGPPTGSHTELQVCQNCSGIKNVVWEVWSGELFFGGYVVIIKYDKKCQEVLYCIHSDLVRITYAYCNTSTSTSRRQ
jgi:hypothetical protein